MRFNSGASPSPTGNPDAENNKDAGTVHQETVSPISPSTTATASKWKLSRGDGDAAMSLFRDPAEIHEPHDPAEEKRLVRKIDFMILPYLAVCYAFFYIDKTTLSYAAIFGIREDLDLQGTEYNWLSSIFYFGFLAWAFPTNFMLQRFPVGKYLGFNIFLWGVLLMAQAGAKNFGTLAALRALSGAAEACADPAFMLITCMWYTRRQQPVRIGLWYTANGFGIALGGLLGYGIGQIRGSLASWKYEFLIIGALCSIWGIVMFFFLPDSPVTAPMLSQREKRLAVERLRENQTGVENKHFKAYQAVEAFKDPKTYMFFILGLVCNTPNGGISNFGTIIIKGFGYSTLVTTLLQMPYGALIALSILSCIYLNDYYSNKLKKNTRCWFILLYLIPNIAGTFGLRFVPLEHHVGRLWCYYLTGPYNAAFVLILSLSIGNTAGHTKKVVTNACLFLGYCAGNIAGPFFFKTEQQPTYPLGIWSMIFCHLLEVVLVLCLRTMLSWENKKRDKKFGEGTTVQDLDATAFGDLTDWENENFRYVY
ncbi:Major facilitator superfamily [Botryosphaeria dothidea]|uniref:Major facilitator superfamily n=1 Tax=Botryosphaeria dothidea TaxID=55169 RepID=A0A8H4N5Z4_9PEZI|nr:Major facilitator superfamily [Botryosphaeria dothidea]